jgi:hypothetical protein
MQHESVNGKVLFQVDLSTGKSVYEELDIDFLKKMGSMQPEGELNGQASPQLELTTDVPQPDSELNPREVRRPRGTPEAAVGNGRSWLAGFWSYGIVQRRQSARTSDDRFRRPELAPLANETHRDFYGSEGWGSSPSERASVCAGTKLVVPAAR